MTDANTPANGHTLDAQSADITPAASNGTSGIGVPAGEETRSAPDSGGAGARQRPPGAASPAGWFPSPAGEAAPPVRNREPVRSGEPLPDAEPDPRPTSWYRIPGPLAPAERGVFSSPPRPRRAPLCRPGLGRPGLAGWARPSWAGRQGARRTSGRARPRGRSSPSGARGTSPWWARPSPCASGPGGPSTDASPGAARGADASPMPARGAVSGAGQRGASASRPRCDRPGCRRGGDASRVPPAAACPARTRESGWQLAQRAWRDSGRDWETAPGRPPVPGPRQPDAYARSPYGRPVRRGPYRPRLPSTPSRDPYAPDA